MIFKSNLFKENTLSVCLNLNSICQFKCPYCFSKNDGLIRIFSKTQLKKIIAAIKKSKFNINILILGGEPTLFPDLNDVLFQLCKLENIKEIEIYTNGKRDVSKIFKHQKITIVFSFHPTEQNDNFIKHVLECKKIFNCRVEMMVLQNKNFRNIINDTYENLKNYITIIPNYVLKNEKLLPIKETVNIELESYKRFTFNNNKYSLRDIYIKKLNNFFGYTCFISSVTINRWGDVYQSCLGKIGNVFETPDIFKFIKIKHICNVKTCEYSCFWDYKKIKL